MMKKIEATIDLYKLIRKEAEGTLTNNDFTTIWTNIVAMPIYRIEYIITSSIHTETGYDRDQAYFYGMLNRIHAFLLYERRIVCKQVMNLELSSIFNRIIMEDNITLQYYLLHPEQLDNYRRSCLKAEKDFEKKILKNREERKQENTIMNDWEDRLLRSIYRSYATVGLTSDQIQTMNLPKSRQISDMAKAVGLEDMYIAYKIECHNIHGDWFDISRYFLDEKDGKFYPRFTENNTDIRKLNSILLIVYKTLYVFIRTVKGHCINPSIEQDFAADEKIISMFDMMHFNFINKRSLITDV